MRSAKIFLMFLGLIVFPHQFIAAQTEIQSSVLANGGILISGINNRIVSSVGQSAIGAAGNSNNIAYLGFWYQASTIITTEVEQISNDQLPKEYRLDQNYPNPFNPTTIIQFSIPKGSVVILKVFDLLGRKVAVLMDDELRPGYYKIDFNASRLPSGIYFYRLNAAGFSQTRKMMLIR